MNLENLEITIDVLQGVARTKRRFYMGSWVSGGSGEVCQTAGCALGYAALDPRLQVRGLTLVYYDDKYNPWRIATVEELTKLIADVISPSIYPIYNGKTGFEAAVEFYGITSRASDYIFEPAYYPDMLASEIEPEHVVAHIRRVIELHGQAPLDED